MSDNKMMSLPQLLDGLGRERANVVQKALALHQRAFRSEFLKLLKGGTSPVIEEHIARMAVLFETITNFVLKSEENTPFIQNVLKLVVDHINMLQHELEGVRMATTRSSTQQERAVLELLDFHVKHLQKLILERPSNDERVHLSSSLPRKIVTVHAVQGHSGSLMDYLSSKTDEEVVRHSLLSSDAVIRAKQILLSRGGKDCAEITDFIHSVADAFIIQLLHNKQIDVAKDVLRNTDRDIWPALKLICLNTVHSNIRDFLAFELNSISFLEHVEIDAWKFLILVEGIIKDSQLVITVTSESMKVLKRSFGEGQMESPRVSITRLLSLPSTCKQSLLMDLYFETLNGTLETMLHKDECWNFLLSNDRLETLIKWVHVSFLEEKGCNMSDRLTTFLLSWDVSQEMIDFISVSNGSCSTREGLLDCLSKFGIHSSEEMYNIHKLLSRALNTGRLCNSMDNKVKDSLVEFCIELNLPDLMVSVNIGSDINTVPWIELYSRYQTLSQTPHLKNSFCKCIIITVDYLKMPRLSNEWISLASCLLSDQLLSNIINQTPFQPYDHENDTKQDNCGTTMYLPQLVCSIQFLGNQITTDIYFQFLLQKKYSSHISHQILKEQSLCRMFKDGPFENEIDFSQEVIMLSHGHEETLDFKYFIERGRPCSAAMLLLSQLICSFGKPPLKMLKRASQSVHKIAFHHIMDQGITTSCIAFMEMLGLTSLALRTHVASVNHVMSLIGKSYIEEKKESDSLLWHNLLSDGMSSIELLEMFDLIKFSIPFDIHKQGLAVQFASIHKLQPPINFLVSCAQKDDWMSFLLFNQIYSYPSGAVRKAIKYFNSVALKEHLESLLSSDLASMRSPLKSAAESPRHKMSPKLFFRESRSTEGVLGTQSPSVFLEDDLFEVLLSCHDCADPAEVLLQACVEMPCPILAVMAEFYQANAGAQLIAWLISWFLPHERGNYECHKKNISWPPEVCTTIFMKSLESCSANLHTAFKIFLPEHPLILVLEVIEEFQNGTPSLFVKALQKFGETILKLNTKEETEDSFCLSSTSYVRNVGLDLLLNFLKSLSTVKDKIKLLQILCEAHILLTPDGKAFDPSKLLAILNILSSIEFEVDVGSFIKNFTKEAHQCIEELMALHLYKEAGEVASISAEIDEVTFALATTRSMVSMQTEKFQKWLGTKYQDFKSFCNECSSCFNEAKVDPLTAFNFFSSCASSLEKNVDRWRALHCASKWLLRATFPSCSSPSEPPHQQEQTDIELWQCCMTGNDQAFFIVLAEELKHSPLSALCIEELGISNNIFSETSHEYRSLETHNPFLTRSVELINCLLDIGDIVSAGRVKKLFQSKHQDLEILETCISIMEGGLNVEQIPFSWALSSSIPLTDSNSYQWSPQSLPINSDNGIFKTEEKKKDFLTVQELCKHLKHGKQIGKQLVSCSRLAFNLDLSYKEVISVSDPLKLLRMAVSQGNNYSVVSDIMTALRLSDNECAKLLSCEIIAAISKSCTSDKVKDILLWGLDMEQNFHHLLELIPDPFCLGNELMNMISKLAITGKSTPKAVLYTAVELLVRSHDCFSAACHMEGISLVLRTVSSTTLVLKTRSEWALMVRLLTGIQRYTEMNFIFKVLKENDQFEYLLRKGSIKPLGFKLALLDWLRRECADDIVLLKMTAAHFKMHKEEAELWGREGGDCLRELLQLGLINNQKTRSALQTALLDFSHASECYLQAGMLHHAMTCAHQAQLVALQLHLLSSRSEQSILRVINLDSKDVSKLIISKLGFNEGLIVAKAYNHRTDWAAALFYHCISPGSAADKYFSAWSSCMELTPSLIQNIGYRLQRTAGITREMISKMRWLLGHVQDMDVRYKLASELDLKDMVESLLQAPEVAYLKDTVWLSGFKR